VRIGAVIDAHVLEYVFRIWVLELAVSFVNYFLLIERIYEPRVGSLRAHRIGMTTRIVYVFGFAYALIAWAQLDSLRPYVLAGRYWLVLVLAFEWVGSLLLRRPLREILEGWHVERGFMWPYVLLAYLCSPIIVGVLLRPGG